MGRTYYQAARASISNLENKQGDLNVREPSVSDDSSDSAYKDKDFPTQLMLSEDRGRERDRKIGSMKS